MASYDLTRMALLPPGMKWTLPLDGQHTPMNTEAAKYAHLNTALVQPNKAKEDMFVYLDTKNAPMRKAKEVNDELVAERLANRPHKISELNRMELEREDEDEEQPVDHSVFLAGSPWNDPRMALAKYEYVWHGNIAPLTSIFTEYENRRKENAIKDEQARQKELIEMGEQQSEKKRLEDEYNRQLIAVNRAKKQYDHAMTGTDSKAKAEQRILLEEEVANLNLIGQKLGYSDYKFERPIEPTGDEPAKGKNDGYDDDKEQEKMKDYAAKERSRINAMANSAAKVAAMKAYNDYIEKNESKVEGELGKRYSVIEIKNAKPEIIYKLGEEVTSDKMPTYKTEKGTHWRRVDIDRWRVVKNNDK